MSQTKDDCFVCPNCGAEVKMSAKICPECGSDDETGWKPGAVQGGTFIEPIEDFDYEETVARESGKTKIQWGKIIIVIILIFLTLICTF